MSHSKTSNSISRRLLAVILGIVVSALFLTPSVWYLRDHSEACQTQPQHEGSASNSLSVRQDERGGYQLQYHAGEPAEHCKWGHTAEEWIAGLTGALVAFTAGLATFTALLWWTTYDLWRSAEEGERLRERAYLRVSLTGNSVLARLNQAETRMEHALSTKTESLREALAQMMPWEPPGISFRVTNHGKTPADLISGKAIFSYLAAHAPDKISNAALEAITFNRSSLAPTESTDPETRFPDTVFEEEDAVHLKNETGGVLFFDCIVAYKDIWEETHTEVFRAVWNPERVAFDITRWEEEIRALQEGPLRKKLRRNARMARRWRLVLQAWGPTSRWLERKEKQRADTNNAN